MRQSEHPSRTGTCAGARSGIPAGTVARRGHRLLVHAFLLSVVLVSSMVGGVARADDDDDDEQSWSDKIGAGIKNTFTGAGKAVGIGGKPEGPPPVEAPSGCPTIAILEGTNGQRVSANNASGNQGVRYQYSLTSVGRECTISGNQLSLKVAASGRVLLGPAGSPGTFDVPLRVVVFNELQQKPVTSKLYRVPSSVGAGRVSAPFDFVSESITVPSTGKASVEYSIKVGIDAGKGGDAAPARKTRRHAKPVAAATQ